MATKVTPIDEAQPAPAPSGNYWFSRLSKPLIFLIIALIVVVTLAAGRVRLGEDPR